MTDNLKASLAHWPELSQSVFVPHTEMEYRRLVVLLDQLVDEVGNDESHPLASLMEVVGLLIEKYEDEQVPELEESSAVREDPPSPRPRHSAIDRGAEERCHVLPISVSKNN